LIRAHPLLTKAAAGWPDFNLFLSWVQRIASRRSQVEGWRYNSTYQAVQEMWVAEIPNIRRQSAER